ncbi:ComEA family DNA-binding protein [Paenibacillus alba]|uniref:ComEA family DNA-binding protein n=1 Tax=Paenibacillus alba TaxID=1197127 RepID=A0ABU6G8T3_9BACL|nr:ComEA family DNA-binding protein [Paenibacillus alba]MEC0230552.1 ComEA family DNA-binding protein [Paenibacillus alba]
MGGYRKVKVLLILAVLCLLIGVVWPFLRGGRSQIETEFVPMNNQMQAMLEKVAEESIVSSESKPVHSASPAAKSTAAILDLNSATFEQLNELPGIGNSKAQAILDYRLQKGRFSQVDELTEVKGIGEKMLEKLKPLVYVSSP